MIYAAHKHMPTVATHISAALDGEVADEHKGKADGAHDGPD